MDCRQRYYSPIPMGSDLEQLIECFVHDVVSNREREGFPGGVSTQTLIDGM